MLKEHGSFIWDPRKERVNVYKHRIDFITAAKAFEDPKRKIFIDSKHSEREDRYFCIGKVGDRIITIRFTYRNGKIRMIGAGYWRKGIRYYEKT
ncbi:MAG: BrnT family toxin [Candidatus Omnitrophica bacterium]|nr:BrnT family toxin [Candidatus Omnitrophota bacterium]